MSRLRGLVVLAFIVASVDFTTSHNFSLTQSARSVRQILTAYSAVNPD